MELSKIYEPQAYEAEIYDLWLASGAFGPSSSASSSAKATEDDCFAIIMPPPNANAKLHIGQATYVKQDIKARYRRMRGDRVLYLPGADHAGFETWYVFEKELAKHGKSKFDFSNKELYQMTWDFVMENIDMAKLTYKQLGLSCSWDHFTFTLDERIVKNVQKIFKKMWDEGLVYRGKRLVNYCTFHQTSFSDIEVDYEDRKTPLYYIKYGPFEVATTRPETILGDTAVVVHPKDERYLSLVSEDVEVEALDILTDGKRSGVRVVADAVVGHLFDDGGPGQPVQADGGGEEKAPGQVPSVGDEVEEGEVGAGANDQRVWVAVGEQGFDLACPAGDGQLCAGHRGEAAELAAGRRGRAGGGVHLAVPGPGPECGTAPVAGPSHGDRAEVWRDRV
jgi:valyl-tRNA synthetase